ncbi:trafficking protein particle complex subunit 4 isoform X1 [Tamandua tetradactyla]|uniref:trafficking protein particle complex subunit 4 isoform X1 n=1 Tax=Tamandua tetradactyla TaxID=48850 RepID=UPI0040544F7B
MVEVTPPSACDPARQCKEHSRLIPPQLSPSIAPVSGSRWFHTLEAHHREAQRAIVATAALLRCRGKKETLLSKRPQNLHPQKTLPGQWAEPRGGSLGHAVLAINGLDVNGKYTADGKEVLEYLGNPANYPVSIRFGRPRLTSNEKLMLASMFHSLFAIGSQLSPEQGSSGIEMLETDTFKLHCFQTLTGIKFVVLADPRQAGIDSLLRKIYEIYSDFALKNPFYSLEMPIRCELFDQNLKLALEVAEKAGTFGPGS